MSAQAPVVISEERYELIANNPALATIEEQVPFLLALSVKQNAAIMAQDLKEYQRLGSESLRYSKAFNAAKVDAVKNVRVPYMNEVVKEFGRLRDYFLGLPDPDDGSGRTVLNEDGSVKETGPLPYPVRIELYIGANGNLLNPSWTDQKSEKVTRHRAPGPRSGVITKKDGSPVLLTDGKPSTGDFSTKKAAIIALLGEDAQWVKDAQGNAVVMANGKKRPANPAQVLEDAGYIWTPDTAEKAA